MKFGTLPPRSNGKHPGGRPSKMTPELVKELAGAIAEGLPDQFACNLVGINTDTLHDWRNSNEEFSEVIKRSVAKRMLGRIKSIDRGSPGYQGTCWMLERRWPQHFARPELQVSMQVQHSGSIEHTVQMVAESELQRMSLLVREIDAEVTLE
jgi:hypothetical protein